MSGLPSQIPQQSVPLIAGAAKSPQYMDINWYLWAYNISKQVLGTSSGGGSTPSSPYDLLDAANLIAQGSDIPQAYRRIANLAIQMGMPPLQDPAPAAQPVQAVTPGASPFTYTALSNGVLSITGGAVSAVSIIRQGVAVATGITSSSGAAITTLTDEKGSGGQPGFVAGVDFTGGTSTTLTLSGVYAGAADLWVQFDGASQGPNTYTYNTVTKVLTFNAAIPVGTVNVFVKGASSATVGASAGGLVPVRRLDQVQIAYTSAPVVAFLPA